MGRAPRLPRGPLICDAGRTRGVEDMCECRGFGVRLGGGMGVCASSASPAPRPPPPVSRASRPPPALRPPPVRVVV
eukprot:4217909-Pleurochrysis_carterae.AAC.1